VIIVGGGFGGLAAARELHDAAVDVTLIDRTNHHLFQPLLYQVATGVLSPADIASPIRFLLRRQRNTTVVLADVTAIDLERHTVSADHGRLQLPFDYLIVAAGARHSYFGHPEWEPIAPGLKTLDDARHVRSRFLMALELAEKTADPEERAALLTFVIVGGGPTGVELAGILPSITVRGFRRDFRRIDTSQIRVILLEGGPRVLPGFPEPLSRRACRDLEELGVKCRTQAKVTQIAEDGVAVGEEWIASRTVFWAAGNTVSPLIKAMGVDVDRSGRAFVNPDLSLPGHPESFVIGDAAAVPYVSDHGDTGDSTRNHEYVPALAAAAKQMGSYAARTIERTIDGQGRQPFRYRDRGMMAVIGRGRAIATLHRLRLTGPVAFYTWFFVHLLYLAGFRNRISVMLEWAFAYVTYRPTARLLTAEDAAVRRRRASEIVGHDRTNDAANVLRTGKPD
jgi:NADH dehydrogenase